MVTEISNKAGQLRQVAINYVNNGLGGKNFDSIPYDENVSLRAPLCPGGSFVPLIGKENLREHWWAPLPGLVGKVTILDVYVNELHSKVAVEFHCEVLQPSCTLRIIDRFKINEAGNIIEQENFFDPRAVTNPVS
jgi:hypothetical protein